MKELLSIHYGIQADERTIWNGLDGFRDDNFFYFIIPQEHKEVIHMEQSALAYYLHENGFPQTSIPIPNIQGNWSTKFKESKYVVFKTEWRTAEEKRTHGEALAQFHETGAKYQYEPQTISSYGQWKQLWANKLDAFEHYIQAKAGHYPGVFYKLMLESLPYLIGISENAIQYMQETELETRLHTADQGTIAFKRYKGQLHNSVIMMSDFVYDHPARDIAEYIRSKLLQENEPKREITSFLTDYQKVRSLSVFSLRMIYARLIYPIHLFDTIASGFTGVNEEECYKDLELMLNRQSHYEAGLRGFFEMAGADLQRLQVPVLHWL